MTDTKPKQPNMVKGVAWLTAGNIISRLLGIAYIIPWYMWLGKEYQAQSNALFNMGYQVYANFLLISTVGLPPAVAKQVAKYNVLGKTEIANLMVRQFFKLMLVVGGLFAGIMYLASPLLAEWSGSKEELIPVMYSLVPPLFIFPAMSILRGFFQGNHDLRPYALSQIAEQVVRVVWILASTYYIMKLGSGYYLEAVVQSTFAAFVGMIASLSVLVYFLWKDGYFTDIFRPKQATLQVDTAGIVVETLKEAVPIIILGLAIQLFQFIDQVTFVNGLSQITQQSRTELLTLYSYVVSNPSKITMVLVSVAIGLASVAIPMVTEKFLQKDKVGTSNLIVQNLQLLFIFLIPALVGCIVMARPLYSVFYGESDSQAIHLFIGNLLLVIIQSLYTILSVLIQAVFESKRGILYFILGLGVKIVLQLPTLYVFKEYGPFVSTLLGVGVMLYFFYRRIDQVVGIDSRLLLHDLVTISWVSFVMAIVVWVVDFVLGLFLPVSGYVSSFVHLAVAGTAGLIVFVLLTLKTQQLDRLIGSRAQKIRKKLRLSTD